MVADSRSSQPSSAPHPAVAIRPLGCATNSFDRNILRVSTFASKILPHPDAAPPQWIQRFSSIRGRLTSAFSLLPSAFWPLSPMLSRFYPQPLSIQRFCSCSHANPLIPKDHRRSGIPPAAHFELIPSMLSPSLWESGKIEA